MDTQDTSALPRSRRGVGAKKHPNQRPRVGGLIHEHTRHTANFTVIGNHLAQHPTLSALAIGIGTYIQSLPPGAPVDIKTLTARFPEGAVRLARAMRELEAEGYLRRERVRQRNGSIISRTISCNQPGRSRRETEEPCAKPAPRPKETDRKKRELAPVPQPSYPGRALIEQATALLTRLRAYDSRLLLSADDTAHLAPGVAAWLERDVSRPQVIQALTSNLPSEPLCRPAALLAHRLMAQLPPVPAFRPPEPPPPAFHPLQNCEKCDRAFRSPAPGRCRDCRTRDACVP